jgi:hypothetical protein
MLCLVMCPDPDCAAAAEATYPIPLWSTHGPVEHVRTYCVHRHAFFLPAELLAGSRWGANEPAQWAGS